jgi:uncharacterized protein (TIGR03083 family)
VSTPAYSELVSAVRREGQGILTAAGMGFDADIPTCEGWQVAKLVNHISKIYAYVAGVVSSRATEDPGRATLPDGEPLQVLSDVLDDVVAALSEIDAETPVWNWSDDAPDLGLFWARRMAHESSVHRFDAQAAHGVMQPIESELAGDGIDELIDMVAPRIYRREGVTGPTGTIALQSSDDGAWLLGLEPQALSRLEVLSEPDVAVSGTSSALLLASYSRIPWTSLDVTGNADLLNQWTEAMTF